MLPQQQQQQRRLTNSRHPIPSYNQAMYASKTLPYRPQRPHAPPRLNTPDNEIAYHTNHSNHSNDTIDLNYHNKKSDDVFKDVPQNLKQPAIPNSRGGYNFPVTNELNLSTIYDDDVNDRNRHVVVTKETNIVKAQFDEIDSVRDKPTRPEYLDVQKDNTISIGSSQNTPDDRTLSVDTPVQPFCPEFTSTLRNLDNATDKTGGNHGFPHVPQTIHTTLRDDAARGEKTGPLSDRNIDYEKRKETRQQVRSIYDNVQYNDEQLFEENVVKPKTKSKEDVMMNQTLVRNNTADFPKVNDGIVGKIDKNTVIETKASTIYDLKKNENLSDSTNKSKGNSTLNASELIRRLNNQSDTHHTAKASTTSNYSQNLKITVKDNEKIIPETKSKNITDRFSKSLTLQPSSGNKNKEEDLNTLQRLNKQGKISARCPNCKWRKVETDGDYCEPCKAEYLSTLQSRVNGSAVGSNDVSSNGKRPGTLEKLRRGELKKFKCVQCGWKQVECDGDYCENCQSEYL